MMAPSSRQHSRQENDEQREQETSRNISSASTELPIQYYVPDYLKHLVFPCAGDFCQSPCFHKRLIAQLMAEGFLPIATEGILLPKLHRQRCVIRLPDSLVVKKSVRKKSKRFSLTVNRDFNAVIQACHEQHGATCWLVPPLAKAFRDLHQAGSTEAVVSQQGNAKCRVRMYSVEVWNQEGTLVGGELGYTVGSIYTSLTGFCRQNNAGSVQLAALGRLLCQSGFTLWDLGMDMEYKRDLGSQLMPRSEFVQQVRRVRVAHGHLVLPASGGEEPVNCRDIIDHTQHQNTNEAPPKKPHAKHESPVVEDDCPHKKARGGSPESVAKLPDVLAPGDSRAK
jgi:Leu/Phe-tRNA-protein transferase